MKTVALKKILKLKSYYGAARMREIYAGRKTWTIVQIIQEIGPKYAIPPKDLIWTALRKDFFTPRALRLLACKFATRALSRVANPDPRSVRAVEVARRYAVGMATDAELDSARVEAEAAWEAAAGMFNNTTGPTRAACAVVDVDADAAATATGTYATEEEEVAECANQISDIMAAALEDEEAGR